MKKVKLTLGLLIIPFIGVSQSTSATNTQTGGQTRYLGFDNNFSLRTLTNGVNRMLLAGGNMSNNAGRLALGNNLPNSFSPANRLHLHQDNGNFGIQFTNNNTGITAANGFEMNLYNNSIFQFHQHQMANVNFRMPSSLLMQLTWNNGPSNAGIC